MATVRVLVPHYYDEMPEQVSTMYQEIESIEERYADALLISVELSFSEVTPVEEYFPNRLFHLEYHFMCLEIASVLGRFMYLAGTQPLH